MILIVFRRKRRELTEARPQIVSKSPISDLLLFSHHTFFSTTPFLEANNKTNSLYLTAHKFVKWPSSKYD